MEDETPTPAGGSGGGSVAEDQLLRSSSNSSSAAARIIAADAPKNNGVAVTGEAADAVAAAETLEGHTTTQQLPGSAHATVSGLDKTVTSSGESDSRTVPAATAAGDLTEEEQALRRGSLVQEVASGSVSGSPTAAASAAATGFVAPSSYLRPATIAVRGKPDGVVGGAVVGSAMGASRPGTGGGKATHPLDKEQIEGLVSACLFCDEEGFEYGEGSVGEGCRADGDSLWQRAIRAFLKVRTTYDVLPLSYRLIVLDTALLVKKSLDILIQCGAYDTWNYGTHVRLINCRHCVSTTLGFQDLDLRRPPHHI